MNSYLFDNIKTALNISKNPTWDAPVVLNKINSNSTKLSYQEQLNFLNKRRFFKKTDKNNNTLFSYIMYWGNFLKVNLQKEQIDFFMKSTDLNIQDLTNNKVLNYALTLYHENITENQIIHLIQETNIDYLNSSKHTPLEDAIKTKIQNSKHNITPKILNYLIEKSNILNFDFKDPAPTIQILAENDLKNHQITKDNFQKLFLKLKKTFIFSEDFLKNPIFYKTILLIKAQKISLNNEQLFELFDKIQYVDTTDKIVNTEMVNYLKQYISNIKNFKEINQNLDQNKKEQTNKIQFKL
jgi:hypothetical protein